MEPVAADRINPMDIDAAIAIFIDVECWDRIQKHDA